ncbi:FMRFamide receptor [Eurytemora carolleeae]|uniref:FMRFamide receptor n=1 Tax=Eurytemora carolleeae TaxID=1294199 RepID=UPI000C780808|nr:FMRFamide receptor [Eurytemora carolleeae]|eukprot:XP_023322269.1 FMRFamide receptor-like [Eurytemora affinis]
MHSIEYMIQKIQLKEHSKILQQFSNNLTLFVGWLGILFCGLGAVGLVANIASIFTLLSPEMRKHTFNQLLAALAFYDIMYIMFNVPVHAMATMETVENWFTNSSFLSLIYVYLLYPMSAVAFCASTYMTLAVTIERYIAVCRPHQYRTISQTMTNTRRILVYIIPVTALSFALNIPKFMEVTITETNGTNAVDPSQTRKDPTFIFWYTLSLAWHPTLTTGILPFIALLYMNMHIFIGIRKSRQILSGRRNHKRASESNLAITLISIVFMHLLCNALRVFLGVMIVLLVDVQVSCMRDYQQYIPPLWIMCLESVAHLLVMLNFSSNFLVYCSVSSQFKTALTSACPLPDWLKVLCKARPEIAENGQGGEIPLNNQVEMTTRKAEGGEEVETNPDEINVCQV